MFAGNFDGFLRRMIGKLFPVPVVHILRVMVRIVVPIRDKLFSVVHNLRVSVRIVPIRRDKLFPVPVIHILLVMVRIELNPEIVEILVHDI